jgi:hypothetical protein
MKFPERFYRQIFKNSLDDHELDVEFRCLHPLRSKDSLWPKQFWARSLEEMEKLWPEIEDLNKRGYQIHFTIQPRLRKFKGNKEHPLPDKPVVSVLWADLDVGKGKPYKTIAKVLKRVQKLEPLPNLIVKSGTGIHVYYLLEESRRVSLKRLESVLKELTESLHGDKGAARAGRLMRAPNTINWKSEAKKKIAVVHYLSKKGYRLRDLETTWMVHSGNSNDSDQHSGKKQKRRHAGAYSDFFMEHIKNLRPIGKKFEALGLCPFHDDEQPSFCVNLETGMWKCQSSACDAKGNVRQFCERMDIPFPKSAIKRFPRLRVISREQEWTGEEVFNALHKYITEQVYFTRDWQPVVVALWAMGTYLYRQFQSYGHLWFNSPTTHSGKTKLMDVLSTVCFDATEPQLDPTAAVLFRFPTSIGGTLLLDEIDRLDPEKQSAVISVLNSYKSSGGVMRMLTKNKQYVVEKFNVYCPKVIAGINNLPETLQDRCIKIYLHRKRKSDHVRRFTPGMFYEMKPLRDQINAWAVREGMQITSAYHQGLKLPPEADDRLKDMMEPLFAIATMLPKWVNGTLTEATQRLAKDRRANEAESNAVVLGVQALRENFPEDEDRWRLRTDEALEIFKEDVPGIETAGQAQALLRRFGLRSQRVRVGKKVLRSYVLSKKALDKLVGRYGLE